MSDEERKRRNLPAAWQRMVPPRADMAAVRAVALHVRDPITGSNIGLEGGVEIGIPASLDPNPFRRKAVPHLCDQQCTQFDSRWHVPQEGPDPNPRPALTFWLEPGAIGADLTRDKLESKLRDFAEALAIEHHIPANLVRVQLCIPPTWMVKFDTPVAGAVVLAVPPEYAHKLKEIRAAITRERIQAEKDVKQEAIQASNRISSESCLGGRITMPNHKETELLGISELSRFAIATPDILTVPDNRQFVVTQPAYTEVKIEKTREHHIQHTSQVKVLPMNPAFLQSFRNKPTHALVVWLDPQARHMCDKIMDKKIPGALEGQGTTRNKPNFEQSIMMKEHKGQLDRAAAALSSRLGLSVKYEYFNMKDNKSPTAILFFVDEPNQRVALQQVGRALIDASQYFASSRGEYLDNTRDRRSDGLTTHR